MNRTFLLGLAGIVTATAIAIAPLTTAPAKAQNARLVEELNLTEEQQAEIQAIFEARRAEIDDILTDEQQADFRAVYSEVQDVREAIAAVDDLTDAQKEALQGVVQSSRSDLSAVLTDEQLAELRTLIQQHRRRDRR